MGRFRRIRTYFARDIWELDLSGSPVHVRVGFYILRALALVFRGLTSHRHSVWASSLTYMTLIGLVPFVALVTGIGAQLGVPGRIVRSFTGEMPEAQRQLLEDAAARFEGMEFRLAGLLSILLLVFAAVQVLLRIEKAFNEIWGVEKRRGAFLRTVVYVSVVIFAPALLFGAIMLTGAVLSTGLVDWLLTVPGFAPVFGILLRLLPLLATCLALSLLYWLLPYAVVRFRAALIGGITAGLFSHVGQLVFFRAQIGAARLGEIYGAFAAIPIFLVWVYVNWILILLGMEITYGAQHAKTWFFPVVDEEDVRPGPQLQDSALRVVLWLAGRSGPRDAEAVGEALEMPARVVNRILETLETEGVLVESESREEHYALARPPEEILAAEVTAPFRGDEAEARAGPEEAPTAAAAVNDLRDRSRAAYRVPISELRRA